MSNKEIKILTGEIYAIKTGFTKEMKILYAGMSNENTFSVVPVIKEHEASMNGYGYGFSPSIYYPKKSNTIRILDELFTVKEVNSNYIILILR